MGSKTAAARKTAKTEKVVTKKRRGATPDELGLVPLLGANLRRHRLRRGLSLEGLARESGVSRAMLGQMELGKSAPTIGILWKVAKALDVPFAHLLEEGTRGRTVVVRRREGRVIQNQEGTFQSRPLLPGGVPDKLEFYELTVKPGAREPAEPHAPGTTERLVLARGIAEIDVGEDSFVLGPGDSMVFMADVPHEYRNPGEVDAVLYLVMTYAGGE